LSLENKSKIELPGLIEEVLSLIKIPSNTTVLYNNKEQTIYTSRNALKQILLNLLHNAIEYNDKPDPLIEIHIHEDKTTWFFEVKDNGPGIGENDTKKIFEIFERLHRKIKSGESMGIGLAIVKRLVEKLGGEIKVTSIPGKGASFEFSIPK
jgi:signal transduction histidine kinase